MQMVFKMYKKVFKKIFNEKVDAVGLSLFRMFYAIILFCELKQLYSFRHVLYDKEPFSLIGELDVSFLFKFWFIVVLMLLIGLFTRLATILNYIFSVIIFSSAITFEYHVFYAYVGINFLLLFLPVSRVLSLDSLLQKLKYTTLGKPFQVDRKILKINYVVPVFVAIGLVYFDSIFHKFSSKMWMDGLGVWLPSSLPMITWNDTSFLLNQKWLMLFLGYLVLVFETVFIFLFWFKKFRFPFFLLGTFFHFGILIAYPIPWFALTVIAVYLLMVPVSYWKKLFSFFQLNKPIYKFYYDLECPLCNKVIVVIQHFDIFKTTQCVPVQGNYKNDKALEGIDEETLLINIHGVTKNGEVLVGFWAYVQLLKAMLYTYPIGLLISLPGISFVGIKTYNFIAGSRLTERCTVDNCAMPVFNAPVSEVQDVMVQGFNQLFVAKLFWKLLLIILSFGQLLMIWFSPGIQNYFPKSDVINKLIEVPYNKTNATYKNYLGLTHHPVFMFKNHFEGYKFIFKIESVDLNGNKKIVPLLNENGMCVNSYARGAFWVNYTFRVNSPNFKLDQFQNGIIPYLKYFENKNKETVIRYIVYCKEIEPKEEWEKDFLKKQIAKPWIEVGQIKLNRGKYINTWSQKFIETVNNGMID